MIIHFQMLKLVQNSKFLNQFMYLYYSFQYQPDTSHLPALHMLG